MGVEVGMDRAAAVLILESSRDVRGRVRRDRPRCAQWHRTGERDPVHIERADSSRGPSGE